MLSHLPRRADLVLAAVTLLLPSLGLTGCSADRPESAGPAATGLPVAASTSGAVKLYFTTANGMWPVWRDVDAATDPQDALDALARGPSDDERARGIRSALPTATTGLRATVSEGRVDITLPWNIAAIGPDSVNQMACTAAAAPGVPGDLDATEVIVTFFEPLEPDAGYAVTCDADGQSQPGETP